MGVKEFGVFVALDPAAYPGLEGMVHISELHSERIRNIVGFIEEGQVIDVKVVGTSGDGKLKLSRKATLVAAAAAVSEDIESNTAETNPE
jgi:polyribonucleotide nucleotidyltransferase